MPFVDYGLINIFYTMLYATIFEDKKSFF